MLRFVVLRHTAPDGAWHFDWMIETRPSAGPDDRTLLTFRTAVLPTEAPAFEAERIGDHRARYLDFQGDLGGLRGHVERIAAGRADLRRRGGGLVIRCLTDGGQVDLAGVSTDGVHFHFSRPTPHRQEPRGRGRRRCG
ncbi:MAG: hypothetical protein KJZ65_15100 [Phycisphaerales bacterium]|nr:hypothetical protein [Phycisphaerales bacterium]